MTTRMLGWMLLHSLWQGGLIALALAALLGASRRAAPSVRYLMALAALALMVIGPVATVLSSGDTVANGLATGSAVPNEQDTSFDVRSFSAVPNDASTTEAASRPALRSEPTLDWLPKPSATVPDGAAALPLGGGFADTVRRWIDASLPWMVGAWLTGLLLLSARLIGGLSRARRLAHEGTSPATERVREVAARLARQLGVHTAFRVLEATRVQVPLVIGSLKPVILLPATLISGLTPAQLEMLLAHELAHIRRHDFLVNLVQTVVETALFYHPGAWWISERIREERENCCDDVALAVCGNDRAAYATALLFPRGVARCSRRTRRRRDWWLARAAHPAPDRSRAGARRSRTALDGWCRHGTCRALHGWRGGRSHDAIPFRGTRHRAGR